MLEFLIDNIMDEFGGHTFQLIMGILIETNCDPLLADLLIYINGIQLVKFGSLINRTT
jgi:hypothetical protein